MPRFLGRKTAISLVYMYVRPGLTVFLAQNRAKNAIYAVLMVERKNNKLFFDAHEPAAEKIGKVTGLAGR